MKSAMLSLAWKRCPAACKRARIFCETGCPCSAVVASTSGWGVVTRFLNMEGMVAAFIGGEFLGKWGFCADWGIAKSYLLHSILGAKGETLRSAAGGRTCAT